MLLNWLLSVQVVMIEGRGPATALSRSKVLTKGQRGRLGGMVFLVTLIAMVISGGLAMVIPDSVERLPFIGMIIQQSPSILLAPFYPGVLTLAYFDARVRKEAFDLEVLSTGIGTGTPDVTTSASTPA
jgi:hypothetical protein